MKRSRAFRFKLVTVLVLTVLSAFPETCLAYTYQVYQTECRLLLMDLMTECSFHGREKLRDKRGMEKFDLRKVDYKRAKFKRPDEVDVSSDEVHEQPQKRNVNLPEFITDALKYVMRIPRRPENDNLPIGTRVSPFDTKVVLDPTGVVLNPVAVRDDFSRAVRSPGPEDILGFEFSDEEADRSYEGFQDRITRGLISDKERVRHLMKCCMDLEYCKKNAKTLVCPHVLWP